MKKFLLSLIIAGAGIAASAQTSPIKFGVKAGITLPKFSVEGDDEGVIKSDLSFYIGGTVDLPVSEIFSVQPGIILSGKGFKAEIDESFSEAGITGSVSGTAKKNLLYIEVPVNAVFSFPIGDGKIFLGAGPYYAMAVSGKDKFKGAVQIGDQIETTNSSEAIEFGKDAELKRGDFGVNFLGGYELGNGFNIHAGYGLGLSNISQNPDATVKNRVLSVGVGFSF